MKPRPSLMNNEGTRSVRKSSYSVQRSSISNTSGGYGTSTSKVVPLYNIEEINESIMNNLDYVTKINPQQKRISRHKSVKADQKSVLNTISSFLSAFEPGFEVSKLQIENLPEVFRLLKHPGNVSKNLFNPVGAKHTWWQCLSVIKWLGQLAHYHVDSSQYVQKLMGIDWELQNILIQNFQGQNEFTLAKLQEYYNLKQTQIQTKIMDSQYKEQNIKMAMQNLQKSQKDLSWAEQEVKKTEQLEFRQINLLTNAEQQIKSIQRQIYEKQMSMKELDSTIQQVQVETKRVARIVQTQTISVAQVRAMQNQISQLRIKNANMEVEWASQGAEYQKQVYALLNKFSEEKASLNFKIEQIKTQSNQYHSEHKLPELTIQLQPLKQYLQSSAPPSSNLIDKVLPWNQQEVLYKIREINSNLQGQLKHVKQNLHQTLNKIKQSQQQNQNSQSSISQLNTKIQALNKSISDAKIQNNLFSSQLVESNTELLKQQQISNEYQRKFQHLVQQSDQLYNTNLKLTSKKKQLEQKWGQIYNNMLLNTRIVVEKVNQQIKDQIKMHNEFNTNQKSKIIKQ